MINITTDTDKLHIYLELTNHGLWPYGTQTLTYAINTLGLEAETELLRIYSTNTGGEQAYCYVNDLTIGGVQATMDNVSELFQEMCYTCCASDGSGSGSSIHIDTDDIVAALEDINETLKNGSSSSGSGSCDCDMWEEEYLTLDEYNAKEHDSTTKYLIYCEDDCSWNDDDIDTGTTLYSSTTVTSSQCDGNDLYSVTTTNYYKSTDNGENWTYLSASTSSTLIEEECLMCITAGSACNVITYTNLYDRSESPNLSSATDATLVKNVYQDGVGYLIYDDDITTIGNNGFGNCTYTSLVIPNCVTTVEYWGLSGMEHLSAITLPNSITEIQYGAFATDTSLEDITLPSGITAINHRLFQGCSSLSSVTMYNNITSIGEYAFHNCSSLVEINFNGTVAEWNAIEKETNWYGNTLSSPFTVHCSDGDVEITE